MDGSQVSVEVFFSMVYLQNNNKVVIKSRRDDSQTEYVS